MSERPLVSILLPVYRAEATLTACLQSVRRQTWEHLECVLVDDGSDDASLDVALSFADRDSRFRVVAAPHRGLVETLNDGLSLCRGAYVARMDADDLMHRERLRLQVERLAQDRAVAGVGCHVRLFPRTGLGEGLRAYERWLCSIDSAASVRAEAFVECPLAHPTWMIRREVLAAHGYRDAGWPEDYDLLLRPSTRDTSSTSCRAASIPGASGRIV
jgi:glycosyltransferase involved in cell wall biosynthesis